jgi:hypothetical protein
MALELVKLYDSEGVFIEDVDINAGTFTTIVDQGSGNKGIKAKSLDDAGNLSAFSTEKRYYAGCTNTPLCDLLDDTGDSASDDLTNDNTPRIQLEITLPIPTGCSQVAASSIKRLELHHKIGSAGSYSKIADLTSLTPVGNDSFSAIHQFISELTDEDHYFKAKWVDAQDGESQFGTELHIVVDTSAPNTPTITLDDGSVFVGDSVTISGTATD